MKKRILTAAAAVMALLVLAACSASPSPSATPTAPPATPTAPAATPTVEPAPDFDSSQEISVVSREDGSGTRGAFIELMGILESGTDGTKTDRTTVEATIAGKTDIMLTSIAGNKYAIGYVSLGSLNDSVKALDIEGVKATAENIKNSTYAVARPFIIGTVGDPKGLAKDFIDFILSAQGQAIVADGYIKIDDAAQDFDSAKPTGKIVVAGSSSVTPVMEKLVEAYLEINTGADIEVQQTDSTAGVTAAVDGIADIAMVSRELKDSEKEKLTGIEIAMDGIAVIVNPGNPLSDLTKAQVRDIFIGEVTEWADLAD